MAFPFYATNTQTSKKFTVTRGAVSALFNGFEIKATEYTWNPFAKPQWGSVDWEISGTDYLLHTIQSHPEAGTGLGGLLMYLAAKEALAANCINMQILSAATSARPFYAQMGCVLDQTGLAAFNQATFTTSDWQKLVDSCPVRGTPTNVLLLSSQNIVGRWKIDSGT